MMLQKHYDRSQYRQPLPKYIQPAVSELFAQDSEQNKRNNKKKCAFNI